MGAVTRVAGLEMPVIVVLTSAIAVTAVALIVLLTLTRRLGKVLRAYTVLAGVVAESSGSLPDLPTLLTDYIGKHRSLTSEVAALRDALTRAEQAARKTLQGIGLVRFNAFDTVGGEQSFALAIVDGNGDGIVVTSLYGREESRVYAKPIRSQASPYALSHEEQQAVQIAASGHSTR